MSTSKQASKYCQEGSEGALQPSCGAQSIVPADDALSDSADNRFMQKATSRRRSSLSLLSRNQTHFSEEDEIRRQKSISFQTTFDQESRSLEARLRGLLGDPDNTVRSNTQSSATSWLQGEEVLGNLSLSILSLESSTPDLLDASIGSLNTLSDNNDSQENEHILCSDKSSAELAKLRRRIRKKRILLLAKWDAQIRDFRKYGHTYTVHTIGRHVTKS